MYKLASQQKLRVKTNFGELSVEQLWDLPISDLDSLAVSLEEEYNTSKGKSFVIKKTTKDKTIKLKFDIVLDILNSKVEIQEANQNARENKEYNQKILERISAHKEKELDNLSVEELQKLIK